MILIKISRIQRITVFLLCIFLLNGCGVSQDNEVVLPDVEVQVTEEADDIILKAQEVDDVESTQKTDEEDDIISEELLDAFLAGEIPAYYDYREETTIMYDQLPHNEDDWERYSVGERIDLDNDGEVELIVNGPYGGKYLDARDGKVYVLAEGEGTTGLLSYANYDNATWIVHSDILHSGRELHWLTRYDGEGKIVDTFKFGAEYWNSPDDKYDENSRFTYRDEEISMSEYEELYKEIFGE